MTADEQYMARCLQLAANGRFNTMPNPMVGAVIVHNGKIIGEGYHQEYGKPHAEVNAIHSVKKEQLLNKATMYVSLEPCSHYGKTPPCADLIIEKKIPRVVIGCRDNFDQVDGKGIQKLREAGIDVSVGVLEKECLELNHAFFTFHTKKRPYIILKWAQSADGYIDKQRNISYNKHSYQYQRDKVQPVRFSTNETTMRVHRLRTLSDAILVGRRTAELDNPSLTTRMWPGKNPIRLIIDRRGKLNKELDIFNNAAKTIVFTEVLHETGDSQTEQVILNFDNNILHQITDYLHKQKVQQLLVEGGTTTIQNFIDAGIWDEIYVETAPIILKDGIKAPTVKNAQKKNTFESFGHQIEHFLHEKLLFYSSFNIKQQKM